MQAMEISMSGLDVEWQRLQVIAQNIANVNTSRTADGGVYRPLKLVSGPKVSFGEVMSQRSAVPPMQGVTVYGVEAQNQGVRRVYEPAHPHADADGFVSYPEIDHAAEMTSMIKTSRAYEANLVALNISMQMYSRALDIGKQQ
ncbi:flagellar basal body rod protein FlgC [Sphingorhabdus sp. Alg239-R122]|uniref:flagellar basal body rod protein FlgC n=1 Tax=Sphingorhabdus sp. Alg239-R122 TaxID=2305989 RepID=UPI0013D9DFBA|nr:flagellar basal body rod protein FlgC [Sphingorhabdus sp. Alg239-R122]